MRGRYRYEIGLLALVILAFVLRVYRLDAQSLWVDEALTLSRSQQPFLDLLRNMPAEHAPLYFTMIHFWLPLAGTTDFAIRFPSLFFGLLCVPLIGQLGTALFGRRVGLLAALLLAINPFHVWYAQDARMYPLVVALSLACLVSLVAALHTNQWWRWAMYAASGALALYTHYYAGLVLVASALFGLGWLIRSPGDRPSVGRRWLAAVIAIGLMFLPWLPQALRVFDFYGWRPPIEAATLFRRYLTTYSLGTSVPDDLGWWLTWGFLALALVGLVALVAWARRDPAYRPGAGLMLTLILVSVAGGALLAVRGSDFQDRYFMVVTPAYYLAIALGLIALAGQPPPAADHRAPPLLSPPRAGGKGGAAVGPSSPAGGGGSAVAMAVGLAFIVGTSAFSLWNHYANPQFSKPDYRQVTAHIARWADPEKDALVLSGTREAGVQRYYPGEPPRIYNLWGSQYKELDEAGQAALFAEMAQEHRQIWLLVKHEGPDPAYAWFSRETFPVETRWITDIFFARFASPAQPLAELAPPASVRSDVQVVLKSYALSSSQVAPGQVMLISLRWVAQAHLERDYKVSMRLVDDAGRVVAAADRLPANGFNPSSEWPVGETVVDRHGLMVPPEASPGEYYLQVKLYEPEDLSEVASARLGPMTVVQSLRAVVPPGPEASRPGHQGATP